MHAKRTLHWPQAMALALLSLILGACATPPDKLRGEFAALTPTGASSEDIGTPVRWGGRLLKVQPERERTCFEVLAMPLDRAARPQDSEVTGRRFLACHDGFLDPAAFPEQRLVTVTGELTGFDERLIGEYEYRFPVVKAESLYLWAKRADRFHDPYPYPYYPYWRHDPFYHPVPRRHRLRHNRY